MNPSRPPSRVAMALACLYAPYARLLLLDHPCDSYRRHCGVNSWLAYQLFSA